MGERKLKAQSASFVAVKRVSEIASLDSDKSQYHGYTSHARFLAWKLRCVRVAVLANTQGRSSDHFLPMAFCDHCITIVTCLAITNGLSDYHVLSR